MYSKMVCGAQFLHEHLHRVSVPGTFLFSLISKIQQIGLIGKIQQIGLLSKVSYNCNSQDL